MDFSEYEYISEELKKRRIPPIIKRVVSIMLDKKGEKIVVIKLKGVSDITDFMIICHGNSVRQNKAISDEVQGKLRKEYRLKAFSVEGNTSTDWILLDYIDFVVHVFSPENREKYALEKLWMDGKRYHFYRD
ncbi:MAG: ribosome silencing factor [Candidatus Aminicenantes bacterium]|nr:ribosome silencing factor [Candidatus Aminicenantes bacterium]